MGRYAYVNGRYTRHDQAMVHIEDRGYQFSDGVYEVCLVRGGSLIDNDGHMRRLGYSLGELEIDWPVAPHVLPILMKNLIRKNRVQDGLLYLQVTRGVAPRNHLYPDSDTPPALTMTTKALAPLRRETAGKPGRVITLPDLRWQRRDIKTVSLLPNCMAKQKAHEAGAYEAWMIDDDGMITEGTASNAWIVTDQDVLVTRRPSNKILNGITRMTLHDLALQAGLKVEDRAFSRDEALNAQEAFCTSTSVLVKPITEIDAQIIGDGTVGPFCTKLLDAFFAHMDSESSQ